MCEVDESLQLAAKKLKISIKVVCFIKKIDIVYFKSSEKNIK